MLNRYLSFLVMAGPLLMLAVKGGYVLSNFLLLLLAIIILNRRSDNIFEFANKTRVVNRLSLGFWIFAFVNIGLFLFHGSGSKLIMNQIPFLLAPIVYLAILRTPVPSWTIWFGSATAGFAAFSISFYQSYIQGIDRAHGFMWSPIFFGNSSIVVAAIALVGLVTLPPNDRKPAKIFFLGLGAIAGIGASFYSGSKGGWITLPLLFFVVYHFAASTWSTKIVRLSGIAVISLVVIVASNHSSPVTARLHDFRNDFSRWLNTDQIPIESMGTASSRLEMWQFAVKVSNEHPLLGFGRKNLEERKKYAVAHGEAHPIVAEHPSVHNEIMEVYLEHGLIGLLSFLFLFYSLFKIFYEFHSSQDLQMRALSLCGIIFLVLYLEFGLTNVQFSLNAPRNIFCFWAVVLAGLLHGRYAASIRNK